MEKGVENRLKRLLVDLILTMMVVSLIIGLVFIPSVAAVGARIWTDKNDYGPDETVTIFGEGFLSNRWVTIEIIALDLSVDVIYAWTNESGSFVVQYVLD
ncbi:MAG: hypothetical protein QXR45_13680 [Candidatus Bathyarchaeia archaeon]